MKLYRKYDPIDHEKVHEAVKLAYGIEHPERIGGYYAAFHRKPNDIYLSDEVAREVERSAEYAAYIDDCIKRFDQDDLGFVTDYEDACFGEDKYLGGGTNWYRGRYSRKRLRSVILADLFDISYISFVEEDASDIYMGQIKKRSGYREDETIESMMLNEIRYVKQR